jgi:hypothetical protein
MTDNVIPFGGITRLDIDPDRVLSSAVGKLECVVVVGLGKDGEEYFASSMADGADALWYLERCKKMLLDIAGER